MWFFFKEKTITLLSILAHKIMVEEKNAVNERARNFVEEFSELEKKHCNRC